jgi:hypothetical protein
MVLVVMMLKVRERRGEMNKNRQTIRAVLEKSA